MSDKPTLAYWKIRGLGHPIRFLLHYLEIDHEEKYYTDPEKWFADKESLGLPLPNLPYLLDGTKKVTESRAIMKHLCRTRKPELLGKTSDIQAKIDMVDNFLYDLLYSGLIRVAYQYTEELHKRWLEEDEPKKLRYLTEFKKDNQWMAGNDITYVDFYAYEVLHQCKVMNSKCLDKYPQLQEFMTRFEKLPGIQKFMNSESFIKAPCYSPSAIYKM